MRFASFIAAPVTFASAALAITLGLAGCTPAMQAAGDTALLAIRGPAPLVVSREHVFSQPYYQLRVDSAVGSAVLVLGRVTDGAQYWVASSGQVLVVEHGLVRRTTGFEHTLEETRFAGTDPFANGLHRIEHNSRATRRVDWMPGYRYGVRIESRFAPVGTEQVEILGDTFELLRVDEYMVAPEAGFNATNHYWVDARDGTILQSVQQVSPELRLTLTALRPWREGQKP